jgi:hypothetical protein
MKIRNRDINIFSMSALDLFASGMGAFILLAVIALPFFGNVSKIPTEAPLECPKPIVCPKPVPCEVCPPPTPPGFKKLEKLDIVVVLDISGSMGDEIASLKAEIRDIGALLDRLSEQAALRIVVFGDDSFDQPVTSYPLTLVSNLTQIESHINSIYVDIGMGRGSNTREGESVFPGMTEAYRTAFRPEASKTVVVLLTDDKPHVGHEPRLNDATRQFVSTGNRSVSVRYSGSDANQRNYYEQLARVGGGTFMGDQNGSLTAALLLALLPP